MTTDILSTSAVAHPTNVASWGGVGELSPVTEAVVVLGYN